MAATAKKLEAVPNPETESFDLTQVREYLTRLFTLEDERRSVSALIRDLNTEFASEGKLGKKGVAIVRQAISAAKAQARAAQKYDVSVETFSSLMDTVGEKITVERA